MPHTRRNALVAIAALAAIVVGVLIWRVRDREMTSSDEQAAPARVAARGNTKDPVTGAPSWHGQPGVAGRRIAGVVVTEDGAPVRGAAVRLASKATMAGASAERSAISDDAGRFDFGPQPATEYVVVAESAKLTGALERVDLRNASASPPPDQLNLLLHPCTASIHGTIRDIGGGVIPGARVSRSSDGALTTKAGAVADDKGEYELCVPAGGAGVMLSADGYATIADHVRVFGRTRRDFELVPGTTVVGRVIRATDRAAVTGALIELQPDDRRAGTPLYGSSDENGRFQIEGVASGRHQLAAVADQLATLRPIEVIAELGKDGEEVVCELVPTLTIAGKVVERESGKAVVGATVYMAARANTDGRRPPQGMTQADGSFVIDRVFPDEYQPVVTVDGPADGEDERPPTIKVVDTDVTGVVLETAARATISGRVLHGGKPVDGAMIRAASGYRSAVTNHAGQYTLRGLPAGEHRMYAESHRIGAFANGPSVTVTRGEQKSGVDINLDLSGSIAGVVVDQHDQPVGGVYLSFSLLRGKDFGSATTSDDGSFTTRSLSGGGDYVFEVRQRDSSPLTYPPVTGKRFPPITVADGQSHVTGVRIKIRVERLAISGRVTDAKGKPVADVTVRAVPNGGWGYRGPTAVSDEAGAFTLRDLPAGTYDVQGTAARGDAREDKITAGRTDVALKLLEFGRIEGALEGFTEPAPVYALRVNGGRYRGVLTGTRFELRNLPPGDYQVIARSPKDDATAEVSVAAGETKQLTLRVREVGVIQGTAVDAKSRAPLKNIMCTTSLRQAGGFETAGHRASTPFTDASGAFRIDRAPVGTNEVECIRDGLSGSAKVNVLAGQVARVELALTPSAPAPARGHAGLTLETQLGEIMVESVEAGGPAARAGIVVGDVLLTVDDIRLPSWGEEHAMELIEYRAIDTPAKLTLERADKPVTVLLTLVPAP